MHSPFILRHFILLPVNYSVSMKREALNTFAINAHTYYHFQSM